MIRRRNLDRFCLSRPQQPVGGWEVMSPEGSMFSLSHYRDEWFGNIRADLLSGLVVALALIPEAIAFSIIAGVDPKVGLYASFSIA
ncbi:SulP family inorganic anion transporter, partial [Micrococcus sp. SIMBA_131]